jgi:hypothetical protein
VTIDFPQDPGVPGVQITQPNDGEVFSSPGVVTISAIVLQHGSERPVYFYSNGELIGSVAPPPYILFVTNFALGEHYLTAQYIDEVGNVGISSAVRIVVKPFALLSAQLSGAGQFSFTIGGLVTGNYFQVEASSDLLNWFPLMSNIASSNSFQFVDPSPPTVNPRFYRGVQQVP